MIQLIPHLAPKPRPYYGICTNRECPEFAKGTDIPVCPACGQNRTRVLETLVED